MTDSMQIAELKKDNIEVRLQSDLYPSFVKPNKYVNTMNLGPSNVIPVVVSDLSAGTNASTQGTFKTLLTTKSLYSNLVKIQSNIDFKFSGGNIKCDPNLTYSTTSPDASHITADKMKKYTMELLKYDKITSEATVTALASDDAEYFFDGGYANMPFQAPMWGPCCDFLNAHIAGSNNSVVLSNNNTAVQLANASPKFFDLEARKLTYEQAHDYDGLRVPNQSITRDQSVLAFHKSAGEIGCSTFLDPPLANGSRRVNVGQLILNYNGLNLNKIAPSKMAWPAHDVPTISDLENDIRNSLNSNHRGQLFKNLNVTYQARKLLPSPNYLVTVVQGVETDSPICTVTATEPTTELYVVDIMGVKVVTHFSIAAPTKNFIKVFTYKDLYNCIGDKMMWYVDGISPLPYSVLEPKTAPAVALGKIFFCRNEPPNQQYTYTISIEGMQSPFYSPLFSQTVSTASFSNTNTFNVSTSKNTDVSVLFDTFFPYRFTPAIANIETDIATVIGVSGTTLTLMQYNMDAVTSAQSDITRIYHTRHEYNNSLAYSFPPGQIKGRHTFIFTAIRLSSMFDRVTYFTDSITTNNIKTFKILNISAKINNGTGNASLEQRDQRTLLGYTKDIYLGYNQGDISGYKVPYSYQTADAGLGSGSIVSLSASDMSFGSMMSSVAALNVNDVTVTYMVECEFEKFEEDINNTANVNVIVMHSYSGYLEISNSNAVTGTELFSMDDFQGAIADFRQQAQSDSLHINTRKVLTGGSILSSILKAKHLIPKVYRFAKSIPGAVSTAAATASDIANTVHNVANKTGKLFRI